MRMAVSRHWTGCLLIDRTLRERSLACGAHKVRRQLLHEAPPVYTSAIKAWLADDRPVLSARVDERGELGRLRARRQALARAARAD
jgi:hypothetical protein